MIGWIKWMDKIVFIEEWEAVFFLHCPWNPSEPISNLHHLNRWIYISFNSHNGRLCVVFIGNWWSKNRATKCWMSARFIRANWIKEISNLTLNSLSSFIRGKHKSLNISSGVVTNYQFSLTQSVACQHWLFVQMAWWLWLCGYYFYCM